VLGRPRVPLERVEPGAGDLLGEMRRLGIGRALVRHRACIEVGPRTGNELLLRELAGREELVPVWMLTPEAVFHPGGPGQAVRQMLSRGVRAAWMHPAGQDYVLEPWCCGRGLEALQERRVPLLVQWDAVTGRQLHEVLGAYPRLPLILLTLYPLLEQHPNLHVAVTPTYSVYRGIEELCERFGAGRFVFGSGYPEVEGGAALCMLNYADIPAAARQAIGRDNLERLLSEAGT